ncbi:MAG: signal recognition particle protein [Thermoplasmata archaeon]|nr:signal recognition particle protein [Thermoplasmata archaeon]
MVLEKLGDSLRGAVRRIVGATRVDSSLVKEVVKDIQRALIQADVNVKLVLKLTKDVERRALTEKPPAGMTAREHTVRIIYDELVNVMGKTRDLPIKKQRIMMVGLYGSGKTTTIGKLGKYLQKRGLNVGFIAADVHRPAAYDQLSQIAESINVPLCGDKDAKKAESVVKRGLKEFKDYDVVIVDTSGRHSLEDDLIKELEGLARIAKPDEILLVLDATIGQQAGPQAKAFHDAVGITGVIVTKMDGAAKGGGSLSAVSETEAPIVFVGTGEKLEDIERYDASRFISRMLGMGDLESLMERAHEVLDEDHAEKVARKMLSGKFNLRDMYEQMDAVSKLGPLQKIFSMIPGMPGRLSEEQILETQKRLKKFKIIMNSMTSEEMENPRIIKSSRVMRIARGSGTTTKDVRELIKQYNMSRKAIKGLGGNRKIQRQMQKMMKSGEFKLE